MGFQVSPIVVQSSRLVPVLRHLRPPRSKTAYTGHRILTTALQQHTRCLSTDSAELVLTAQRPQTIRNAFGCNIFSGTNAISRQSMFTARTSSQRWSGLKGSNNQRTILFSVRYLSHAASQQQQSQLQPNQESDAKITTGSPTANRTTVPNILTKINPLTPKERKENIYTIPNILTFSRLIAAPAIGYAILTSHPHLALGLFAYAGITDLIDGYLARRFNSQTVVGTIIDPMADKILMTTVVLCLTIQGILPTWLAVIILGRDVALAISAIYFRWISLPPPKTFSRYWDFSLPSAEVHPTEISKINTFLQLLLVGNAMVLPALPFAVVDAWNLYGVFEGWQYLVAGTTVWSGLSYVFSKDAVKILSAQEAKEREMLQRQEQEDQQQKRFGQQ